MPYSIHWEPRGVYKKYTGLVTGEEFLHAVRQVNAHPDFGAFHYVINDFLACTAFPVSKSEYDDILAAAIGANVSNPKFVAAFVAADAALAASLESMVENARSCMRVRIFGDLAAARGWVEAPGD